MNIRLSQYDHTEQEYERVKPEHWEEYKQIQEAHEKYNSEGNIISREARRYINRFKDKIKDMKISDEKYRILVKRYLYKKMGSTAMDNAKNMAKTVQWAHDKKFAGSMLWHWAEAMISSHGHNSVHEGARGYKELVKDFFEELLI